MVYRGSFTLPRLNAHRAVLAAAALTTLVAAALAAARLSAQAELATDYFELRAQDQLQKLLDDTVVAETLSLKITESRYKFGVAARAIGQRQPGVVTEFRSRYALAEVFLVAWRPGAAQIDLRRRRRRHSQRQHAHRERESS